MQQEQALPASDLIVFLAVALCAEVEVRKLFTATDHELGHTLSHRFERRPGICMEADA